MITWSNIKIFKIQNGTDTMGPIRTTLASYHVPDMSAIMRLLWQWSLPCNGPLDIQQLWASEGRTREPILMKFGIQQQIRTTMITWSNIKIFKIQNGTDTMGPIRTTLGWSLLSRSSAAKPFHWYWSLLLKRYGFMECRDQKHPQVWWTLDDCATVVKKIW